jgi:uncharacterized cupredoxin-like copper-binding protein
MTRNEDGWRRRRWTLVAALLLVLVATACATRPEPPPAASSLGHPGQPGTADRTVHIVALDSYRFSPEWVGVHVGETVTLRVHNTGRLRHELVLGTEPENAAHPRKARAIPRGPLQGVDAVSVRPGAVADLTWTFTRPGIVRFGTHEPGHQASRTRGAIIVTAPRQGATTP